MGVEVRACCPLGAHVQGVMRETRMVQRRCCTLLMKGLMHGFLPLPMHGSPCNLPMHIPVHMEHTCTRAHALACTCRPWLHGSEGRDSAPGKGAAIATREFLKKVLRSRIAGTTFIVQVRAGCVHARLC